MNNYGKLSSNLKQLRENSSHLSSRQRLMILMALVSNHPDFSSILKSWNLVDSKNLQQMVNRGYSGYQMGMDILNHIQLKTSNSTELSVKYNGYSKPITGADLNEMIDKVATRVQEQQEYTAVVNEEYHQNQDDMIEEEETTLDELQEFEI